MSTSLKDVIAQIDDLDHAKTQLFTEKIDPATGGILYRLEFSVPLLTNRPQADRTEHQTPVFDASKEGVRRAFSNTMRYADKADQLLIARAKEWANTLDLPKNRDDLQRRYQAGLGVGYALGATMMLEYLDDLSGGTLFTAELPPQSSQPAAESASADA